jgi:hypothetical protein
VSFSAFAVLQNYYSSLPCEPPTSPPLSRHQKRAFSALLKKEICNARKDKPKVKIQGQGRNYHRRYPLRLRSSNTYHRCTPQTMQRLRNSSILRQHFPTQWRPKPVNRKVRFNVPTSHLEGKKDTSKFSNVDANKWFNLKPKVLKALRSIRDDTKMKKMHHPKFQNVFFVT